LAVESTANGAQASLGPSGRSLGSGFIAGPIVDSVFLIGAPLVAIFAYLPFYAHPIAFAPIPDARFGGSLVGGFITTVIFAHLFIVFFRSHLNTTMFRLHRARFVLAPALLFGLVYTSTWALLWISVLATWWDVYHSSLQTFGIGRLYDLRAGNDPEVGRQLDRIWSLVLYAGPVVAGASLATHLDDFESFERVGSALLTEVPAEILGYSKLLTAAVLAGAAPFAVYYVLRYRRFVRDGYHLSPQKLALYAVLGAVSVVCWGFNSFAEAFFVMNFFHALQYFFIVWYSEGRNITRRFGLAGRSQGEFLALALFIGVATSFGVWSTGFWLGPVPHPEGGAVLGGLRAFEATLLVVSILHFWYDGFIWSVRRGQIS
jgi:hypothetical protein